MESISDTSNLHPNPTKRNKIKDDSPSSSTPVQKPDPLPIPIFPDELIIEILSRLPAKSLGKFKCVSRPWLSLISSRRFIKAHLAIASGRDDYSHHGLIFTVPAHPDRYTELKQCSVDSVLCAPTAASVEALDNDIDHPMKRDNRKFVVVGSCDGLVCIRAPKDNLLFLWNPCIKVSKKLPDPPMEIQWGTFGFGYDKLSDDYKVVGIFSNFRGGTFGAFETKVEVYSLKNNCWRQMEDLKISNPIIQPGPYVSGKLHWLSNHGIGNVKIGAIDLASGTYEEMDLPNHVDFIYDWKLKGVRGCFSLGVLRGCLSIVYDLPRADVWVMKEYGFKVSWTKIVSILDYPVGFDWCFAPMLVCLLKNGEILFVLSSNLLLHNPKTNTFREYPQIHCRYADVNMYVESLVSPNAHDGEHMQLHLHG